MQPTSITGRTRLLGVLADPVAQARSPGMANVLLQEKGIFGAYVLIPYWSANAGGADEPDVAVHGCVRAAKSQKDEHDEL